MAQQPQSLYYNAPYPPIMLPSIQYPQTAASPTFSQFTSDSDSNSPTPSPVEYSPSSAHSQETSASYIFNASDQTNHYATLHHQELSQPPYSSPYSTFPLPTLGNPGPRLDSKSQSRPAEKSATAKKIQIAHPYARIFAKKDEIKRRKIWNHALEKLIFTPYELSTLGASHRRPIYISSLEAHVDRLHESLLAIGFWPVRFEDLDPFIGLNSKTAKSMVAGLQCDASIWKLKLLELERANEDLQKLHSKLASNI